MCTGNYAPHNFIFVKAMSWECHIAMSCIIILCHSLLNLNSDVPVLTVHLPFGNCHPGTELLWFSFRMEFSMGSLFYGVITDPCSDWQSPVRQFEIVHAPMPIIVWLTKHRNTLLNTCKTSFNTNKTLWNIMKHSQFNAMILALDAATSILGAAISARQFQCSVQQYQQPVQSPLWKLSSWRELLQSPFRTKLSMGSLSRQYRQSLWHHRRFLLSYCLFLRS